MRIVFFSDTFIPDRNGVATAISSITNMLAQNGDEVMVVAPKPVFWKDTMRDQLDSRVQLVFTRTFPLDIFSPDGSVGWLTRVGSKKVDAFLPDIVHIHTPSTVGIQGLVYARRHKLPVVLHMHTNYYHTDTWRVIGVHDRRVIRLGLAFAWTITRRYANRARVLIAPSQAFADVLAKHVKRPVVPIAYPLEKHWFVPQKSVARPLSYELLYVGRLGEEKRVDLALRVFAQAAKSLPQLTFRIVGDGMAKRVLQELARELDVQEKVFFSGGVARDELLAEKVYRGADWFLSMSTFETLGYTFIESMAQGTPVLARLSEVNREVIGDGGKIFEEKTEEKVIRAMARFLVESYGQGDLSDWQAKARKRAEAFTEKTISDKLSDLYARVIKGEV